MLRPVLPGQPTSRDHSAGQPTVSSHSMTAADTLLNKDGEDDDTVGIKAYYGQPYVPKLRRPPLILTSGFCCRSLLPTFQLSPMEDSDHRLNCLITKSRVHVE